MRVAAFISHPIQYFAPLWKELSSRPGIELTVFYFSRQGVEDSLDPDFGVRFAWDVDLLAGHKHVFLPRQWPTRDPLDHRPRALNSGIVSVLRQGWDAVFVSGYTRLNNWTVVTVCQQLGIPVLCFADTTLNATRSKTLPKRVVKRLPLTWFMRRVSAFLAPGGQTRAYFQHYGASAESVFICPFALDVARFRAAVDHAGSEGQLALKHRWQIPADKRIVMFCGKLAPWKRPLDVVTAVESLARPDLLAVFVGAGELREDILARGGGCVRVTGFVNQREIPIALSLAEVLVLPSSIEPYGMVVAEAQCLGVPAVVSDACGCYGPGSVLQDGVSGYVYPTGDTHALASKLATLLNSEPLRASMGERARQQGDTQSPVAAADGFIAALEFVQSSKAVRRSRRARSA